MSAESSMEDDKIRSLSVEIPGASSSVESSLALSPTGILSPSTSNTTSTSSLPTAKANVTFAPLPELAPRKRRSTAPLGMAARSQLLGRRRRYTGLGGNTMWTDDELEQQERQVTIQDTRLRHFHYHRYVDEEEGDEEEDPLVAFGRVVKSAGKRIWKRMSQNDLGRLRRKQKEKDEEGVGSGSRSGELGNGVKEVNVTANSSLAPVEAEVVLGVEPPTASTGVEEPPVVNEDCDDDEEHFRTIGQTETIREGSAEWIADTLEQPKCPTTAEPDIHAHS